MAKLRVMDRSFWLECWQQGQTGFHLTSPNPRLVAHAHRLPAPPGRVFVPLCGKSVDLAWLASQGYDVLGVELSELAVHEFFRERGLTPTRTRSGEYDAYRADAYTLLCGDVFSLQPADLAGVSAFYDRAALIALPPPLRVRYARLLAQVLPAHVQGLLVTLRYPQAETSGPPFSVPDDEVRALYAERFVVEQVVSEDVLDDEPRFRARGLSALEESVYALISRDGGA